MTKKFLIFPVILFFISSCDLINPIKELECEYLNKARGEKVNYIINAKTGELFEYDDFNEKLKSINGEITLYETNFDIKTAIVNKKWKIEMIMKNIPHPTVKIEDTKIIAEMDLGTMKYKEEKFLYTGLTWKKEWEGQGVCKWIKPKTTEVNNQNT